MKNWKMWLKISILLGLAAGTAEACLYCIPCGEGGEHVCIGAPSAQCFCYREGNCAAYECTDGDSDEACCGPFPSLGHTQPLAADKTYWRITYNNGFQLNFGKRKPPKDFDPLKEVAERFTVEKMGKKLTPVTAVKLESWGETR